MRKSLPGMCERGTELTGEVSQDCQAAQISCLGWKLVSKCSSCRWWGGIVWALTFPPRLCTFPTLCRRALFWLWEHALPEACVGTTCGRLTALLEWLSRCWTGLWWANTPAPRALSWENFEAFSHPAAFPSGGPQLSAEITCLLVTLYWFSFIPILFPDSF